MACLARKMLIALCPDSLPGDHIREMQVAFFSLVTRRQGILVAQNANCGPLFGLVAFQGFSQSLLDAFYRKTCQPIQCFR